MDFKKSISNWQKSGIGIVHKHNIRPLYPAMKDLGNLNFTIPDNLLCIAGHNYEKTLFEEQMEFHGQSTHDYTVVHFNKEKTTPWSHFMRWKKTVSCMKESSREYVLFMDPTDTLFIDSPHNILNNFLIKFNCEVLFNSTQYRRGYRWDKHSESSIKYHHSKARRLLRGAPPRLSKHLNGGVFIGRRDFVVKLYEDVLSYELDSSGQRDESSWEKHPEFPYGCADDQKTLRHLEYKYYPELQIDGKNTLFIRCN